MLAFTPALAGLLVPRVVWSWLPQVPMIHSQFGPDVMNVSAILHRELQLMGCTIIIFSLLIAIIYTRGQPARVPVANTLSVAFCLVVANNFVAFAGCSMLVFTRSIL